MLNSTGTNLLIGIPCYGGQINWRCTKTLIRIENLLNDHGIQHHFDFLAGCSLIPQARNIFANVALFNADPTGRPFSHLLMIDADGSFAASAVMEMLKADKAVVILPFAKKEIRWPEVAKAVRAGIPAERLSEFAAFPMINPANQRINPKEPTPVTVAGTGCILIQKQVLVGLAEAHPDWFYRPNGELLRNITTPVNFFQCGPDPKTKEYLTEDFFFVKAAREAGFETFVLPWIETTHTGAFDYHCNIPAHTKLREAA